MSTTDDEGGICRACGRSCLAHPSGGCRTCRRGKPATWVARKIKETPVDRILTDEEREPATPKGWRERSRELWKRLQSPGP